MPINLTEPAEYKVRGAGQKETYSQAKIVGFEAIVEPVEDAGITLRVQFGDTVDNRWAPGKLPVEYVNIKDVEELADTEKVITPADPKYTNWVGTTKPTSTENLLYAEVAAALYQWLVTQEGFEGEIVS